MKLVIHPAVDAARFLAIADAARPMLVVNAADDAEALREIADANAFFGKLTPELLRAAGKLVWVQSPTASLEHYVFPELIAHPLTLTNMRGLFSDVIADHVMGLVLCFARNFHIYIRQQLEERYEPVGVKDSPHNNFAIGAGTLSPMDRAHQHLGDQTMGIVGLGAIGSEVAQRAEAFGMNTIAVDPVNPAAWPMEQLPALLAASDYVTICAPHTPKTERLFNAAAFAQMRPNAVLVNIGRGAIVDLNALADALEAGQVAGAGLDVFEAEPLPAGHRLWKMPNVVITPHVAGASPRIAERHLAVITDNARRFARGDALVNVVNKREWF
ncbi:MAG: D-2-hydroxyacid dehydrogenase [Acidobacteria bacterium]|nr:D-2-hydroxyacid dehydrogenase [Acidobacteriota bacterium]